MTQIEFITELEQALRGNVDERVVQENVRYYNSYISEQRAAGKSDAEIFASLGSPRLIAKTIIDTSGEAGTQGGNRAGSYSSTSTSGNSSNSGEGWSFSWMKETASKNWVTRIIAILAVIVVAFLILRIIGWVAKILFKPAVVVLAVVAVYYFVKTSSNK